jgi:hypothetical protein
MAYKKQYNNADRDDGVRGELLKAKDNEAALAKLDGMSKPVLNGDGNPPAKSQWSTGRGCPKCKHQMAFKEITKSGQTVVFCHNCHREWYAADLENTTKNGDFIHRDIPDELILRYMMANDARLKLEGK